MTLLPRLAMLVLAPILLGVVVLVWQTLDAERAREATATAQASREAAETAASLGRALEARRSALRALAATPGLAVVPPDQRRRMLAAWERGVPEFGALQWHEPLGDILTAREENEPVIVSGLAEELRLERPALARPQVSREGDRPALLLVVPLGVPGAASPGALAGSVRLPALFDPAILPPDGPADRRGLPRRLLVNGRGERLAGGLEVGLPHLAERVDAPLTFALLGGLPVGAREATVSGRVLEAGGRRWRTFSAAVPGTDWQVWFVHDESDWAQARDRTMTRLAWLALIVVPGVGLLGGLGVHALVLRPVRRLQDGVRRFSAGETDVRVLQGRGELGELAARFNEMAEAAQDVDRRMRDLLATFPHPLMLMRLGSGVILDVNPAFEFFTGIDRERAVGQTRRALGLEGRQSEGAGDDGVQVLRLAHGEGFRWFLLTIRPVRLEDDPVVMVVLTDITPLRETEERMRRSEDRFNRLFDQSPVAMSCIGIDGEGERLLFNRAWHDTFGFSPAQAAGRNGVELGMWPDPARREAYISELLAQGQVDAFPVTLRRADGALRECLLTGRTIAQDSGEPLLVTAFHDATDELESQRQRQRLASMVERANDAFFLVDGGRFVECNPAACELFGGPREQIIGKRPLDLSPEFQPDGRASSTASHEVIARAMAGEPQHFEWVHLRLDGTPVWMDVSVRRFDEDGRPKIVSVLRDISQRKQADQALAELNASLESRVVARTEELARRNDELADAVESLRQAQDELVRAEKLASLGALVAGVAHELNTPIGNALMIATTLGDRRRELADGLKQGLRRSTLESFLGDAEEAGEVLVRNLARAAELIASFKQLSADQSSYQRREFGLGETVRGVLLALSPMLRRAEVTVTQDVPAGLVFDSYPGPLQQVIENLLTNTVAHAFEGRAGGRVHVSAQALDGPADRIRIEVADDGKGMDEAVRRRAFDPFFTTRMGRGGSGLGLHICYTLVTGLLGGRIDVSSQPGEGCRFVIELPRVAPGGASQPGVL